MKSEHFNFHRIFIVATVLFICFYTGKGQTRSVKQPVFPDRIRADAIDGLSMSIPIQNASADTNSFDILSSINSKQSNNFLDFGNSVLSPLSPPANDLFSSLQSETFRLSGSSGSRSGTTVEATIEPNEPNHGGIAARSVWYKWTAPQSGPFKFSITTTLCPTPGCRQVIAVYTGSSLTNLIRIAQDVDSGSSGLTSEVFFQAIQNQEYKIAIDAYYYGDLLPGSTFGKSFSLSWAYNCNIIPISIGQTLPGTLTTDGCYQDINGNRYYYNYYQFTGTLGQQVTITMNSTVFDTYLELYNYDNSTFTYPPIASDDNGNGGTNSRIVFTFPSGTYLIGTSSRYPFTTGAYTVSLIPPPVTIAGSVRTVTGGSIAAPVQVGINCPSATNPFSSSQTTTSSFSFTVPSSTNSADTCTVTPSTSGPNNLNLSWSPSSIPNISRRMSTFSLASTLIGPSVNATGKIINILSAPGTTVSVNNTNCNAPNTSTGDYVCQGVVVLTNGYTIRPFHSTANFNPTQLIPPASAGNNLTGVDFTVVQPPSVAISNVSANEGNSGTTPLNFAVNLSSTSSQAVTVNYSTANGTATAGQDYMTVPNGTVMIPAGSLSGTAAVQVNGDTIVEPNETFTVTLSNAQGANITAGQGTATGTITNDDVGGLLQFSTQNYNINEGSGLATITVTRTGGAASGVTVNYVTSNGTAIDGQDYTATSGTLTFNAGDTSKTFTIPIINDSINEPNETVILTLSGAGGGGSLGNPTSAVLTIIDDDNSAPTLSINNISVTEGNFGTTNFNFIVSLSTVSSQTVTVNYATSNGTATFGQDYVVVNNTISFAPNEINKQITVSVNGDILVEPNETFFVNLSSSTNAVISNGQGTGTIVNDDQITVDFDGDGRSDYVVTRSVSGSKNWFVSINGSGAFSGTQFGASTDIEVPEDYDGDGRTDYAVYRRDVQGAFFIMQSSTNTFRAEYFGVSTDDPKVVADYDGDNKADVAVYRKSASGQNFYYYQRSIDLGFVSVPWGSGTTVRPNVGDYDGDNRADFCVHIDNGGGNGLFALQKSSGGIEFVYFGFTTDKLAPGDYDGDGRSDFAVVRSQGGSLLWYTLTRTNVFSEISWGIPTDIITPGDYDGDGKQDRSIWRSSANPSESSFHTRRSTNGGLQSFAFGAGTDYPAANWFVH